MAWKVAPAIAAGNTVVCKPPHQNPLSGLLLGEVYDVLPPGVVNIVTGAGDTGKALINHPDVDMIAFTGSTAVGKNIASVAGAQLKKINLELGGIDPLLVFEDADLDVAVRGAVWARLLNAGQVCTSSKRIYVVEPIAEEFTKRVVEHVKTLNVGNPMDQKTDMGPLISADAVDKLEQQLATVLSEGAKLLARRQAFPAERPQGPFLPADRGRRREARRHRHHRGAVRPGGLDLLSSRTPTRRSRRRTIPNTASAPRSSPRASSSRCRRWRTSRPAASGSTIR